MGKVQTKTWRSAITDRLRLDFEMGTPPKGETEYSLNLSGLIDGEWETLVRYDNAHGTTPHRHTYGPDGTSDEHRFVAVLPQTFFAEAQKDLTARAEDYLAEYERKLSNMSAGRR